MARRDELTERGWARLAPLLPQGRRRGGQWRDHRQVINGVLWKIRTGARWADIPARYGPHQTCYDRFRRWCADGTWDRLLAALQRAGPVDPTVSVDSTVIRAHQTAACGRKKGGVAAGIRRLGAAAVA
jgi:transposase